MGCRRGEASAVNIGAYVKNRLKVLRAERDWSQAELGGRLGVSRQAVNAIETGKYDPSLPLAFKLSRLFSVPIEEIFDDGFGGGCGRCAIIYRAEKGSAGRRHVAASAA
jgi:putative transcriptional regulator